MLSAQDLENTLTKLVKSKSDFILYGNKSSGKTTLAKKVLNKCLGTNNFIDVNAIFASTRDAFLFLVGDSLFRFISSLDSRFANLLGEQKPKFIDEGFHQSLESWLKNLKRFLIQHEDFFTELKRVYIFIDNIEQLSLSEEFMKFFYYALKRQIEFFKVSFFFCGICHKSQLFTISEPFRNIPVFVMPQPDLKRIIINAIQNSQLSKKLQSVKLKAQQNKKNKKQSHQNEQTLIKPFEKLLKHLETVLYCAFESIEYQIQNLYLQAKCFLDQVNLYVANDPKKAEIWMSKQNKAQQEEWLRKLQTYGPVTLERTSQEITKKNTSEKKQPEEGEATFYMENYPNLIMTSLGLANGYAETEDVKRFIDMKKTRNTRTGSKKNANINKKMAEKQFKQDLKKIKHNYQRIIGIAEVLEDQSSGLRLKEKEMEHHTLDYYGCIQYLREEGYLNFYGKSWGKYGGKIYGHPKESEVKDFMAKIGLEYSQFTDKD